MADSTTVCAFDSCSDPVFAKGYCYNHYLQDYRGDELHTVKKRGAYNAERVEPGSPRACEFLGCSRVKKGRGRICSGHYGQQARGEELRPLREPRQPCAHAGCTKLAKMYGHCQQHLVDAVRAGLIPTPRNKETGQLYRMINQEGYALVYDPAHPNSFQGGWVSEHIVVMAEKIGRPLARGEEVHHLNGHRADNRPENLELWVKSQPKGQRTEDLLAWAEEIIARYKPIEDRL